jgi:hypothetical protein
METIISKSKLRAGDLLETMRFSFCADREAFIDAFKKIGLPVSSEADLKTLEEWHKKGWDKNGMVKNLSGNKVTFDIHNFVNYGIKLRHQKVLNCKIKFVS